MLRTTTRTATTAWALSLAAASLAGCTNLERSRNLGNPDVPAPVLAQQVCSNCHGRTGSSISPNFPNLAAQQSPYLMAQLREFREQRRGDPAGFEYMWGLSRHLTDEQIDGLAAYFTAQAPVATPAEGPSDRAAAGRAIFEGGLPQNGVPACNTCHGAQGEGNGTFPRLAGQHLDYVTKQLASFQRSNERPLGAVMSVVAHGLDGEAIANVAAYVQSMPPGPPATASSASR